MNGGDIDNANANGFATSLYTIAISSVGRTNLTVGYREVGSSIMAVAYGGEDILYNNVTNGLVSNFT